MIGDIVAKEPSGRDRDAEFQTQAVDIDGLNQRLDGSLAYIRQVLDRFSIEDLDAPCVSPFDGRTYSAGLFLFRVLIILRGAMRLLGLLLILLLMDG